MFLNLIDRSEPRIVRLEEPIRMIGVSTKTSLKTIYKDTRRLGEEYQKAKNLIRNKSIPWAFVAISKDFSDNNSRWEYLMGDVVTSFDDGISKGLVSFEIPAKTYAVFTIRPRFGFLWGLAIGLTKRYIYTQWLPDSKYDSDNTTIGDFEYHDERSVARKPSIDLYVSIKEKNQK